MNKFIILTILAGISLPAQALSDYNWYDYNFNLAPQGAAPLILPVLPTSNYNIGGSRIGQPTAGSERVQILGTPSPGSHTKIVTPSGMRDMYTDGYGNSDIR